MSPVPLYGNVGRLDAEHSIQTLVRRMVCRIQSRAAEAQLARIFLGELDEFRERLDRALIAHDQRIRRVVIPVHRRHIIGLVLHLAFERLETRCAAD